MRYISLLLILIFAATALYCQNSGLLATVPANDACYGQLRELYKSGLLGEISDEPFRENAARLLTRYDAAFLLIEPLERCVTLVAIQESPALFAEQHLRVEPFCLAMSLMKESDRQQALKFFARLLVSFSADIDQLIPGLSQRAAPSLKKLTLPNYQPWRTEVNVTVANPAPLSLHFSLNPRVQPDSFHSPLLFSAASSSTPEAAPRFFLGSSANGDNNDSMLLTRPVTSLEAAVDMALGRVRLYGSVGPLPGRGVTETFLRPDGTGKAMVGVEVDILQINALDISGIFEYHVMRYGVENSLAVDTGAIGGIGLRW